MFLKTSSKLFSSSETEAQRGLTVSRDILVFDSPE